MNLTEHEQVMFNLLRSKSAVSVDELVEKFAGTTRHSISVRIKYLSAKVAQHGWIIKRETGVGRGVKGVYSMTKKF